jgi:predicted enzyme related to lactoylglutathione lyase
MAKVLGVGGVFFKSPDPQMLCAWYAQHLGLPVQNETGATFAVFPPEGMPPGGYTVWSPFAADTTYFAPGDKSYMFNLVVDDLAAALEQVRAGGAQVMDQIERSEYGQFGWFMDPDGNKVELWQPPADGAPSG